jgi:hypothetical protein
LDALAATGEATTVQEEENWQGPGQGALEGGFRHRNVKIEALELGSRWQGQSREVSWQGPGPVPRVREVGLRADRPVEKR